MIASVYGERFLPIRASGLVVSQVEYREPSVHISPNIGEIVREVT